MKLLLDECVTNYLNPEFEGHEVSTIDEAGFKGLKNGQLLAAAAEHFEVLVTVDQNLRYQQNLSNLDIAVLVLRSYRTTYPMLKLLVPDALQQLENLKPGDVVIVELKR